MYTMVQNDATPFVSLHNFGVRQEIITKFYTRLLDYIAYIFLEILVKISPLVQKKRASERVLQKRRLSRLRNCNKTGT